MNIQIHPENANLNNCVFRAADRMRIDGCANAVAHEGLSLALYCPFEALLDHYVNLLLARLRQQAPEHRIEVYFPANTDSLLGRFNEVLASQSLNQAVKATSTVNQAQIWLVHDAQTLPESEIQLLARLIQNFPGANIRAILLMSGNTHSDKSPLSAFGRKILRWDIEGPTPEQAQAALDLARHEGHANATQQLVQRIQRQQLPELNAAYHGALTPAAETPAEPTPAPTSTLQSKVRAFHQRGASALLALRQTGRGLSQSITWFRQNTKLTLGVAFALVMSTLVMLWVQPEAFGLKSGQPVAAAPLKSPQLPTPAPAPSPTPAATLPGNPGNAPTAAVVTPEEAQRAPAPMAKTPAESAIEVPEGTQEGQAWLRKLDANSFLLQHGTANSYEKVLDIQRKHPALKQAQIVAAYRPGEKLAHFVIVSGPFSDVGQGYEASKRPGIPRSWVRTTRSLQEQLKSPT
ncbi:MAG: hypothetical protein AAB176_01065 [Pseudomonadota bacterium]|jgi:hypothetical protein